MSARVAATVARLGQSAGIGDAGKAGAPEPILMGVDRP